MGILFLTVKQERCSDLLLWSAAWLLPPLRLMPMLMPTTATAMALDSATLDWAMVDTVLDMEATVIPVLDTPTARGRLRLSPRLMPSTDMELTPTPLDTVTPVSAMLPLPLPPLPSLPLSPPSLPPLSLPQPSLPPLLPLLLPPLPPLPSATPVSDTLVSATLVLDTDTTTARGRPRLSPRLMLTTATVTVSDTATPVSDTDTPVSATATALEPTELDTDTTTVKLVQLNSRSSTQSLPSVLLSWE